MTLKNKPSSLFLIPGHWLGAWAWEDITQRLQEHDVQALALTLPGLESPDDCSKEPTLEEQVSYLESTLISQGVSPNNPAILVAHSGANQPATLLLDRHPDWIAHIVWVDSGPVASGNVFLPDLPSEVKKVPLPAFEELAQQASLEGLDANHLARFRRRAVSEPAAILREQVFLKNPARYDVSSIFICCSITSEQIQHLIAAAHPMFEEVQRYKHRQFIDLQTGHWPMWSKPKDLAKILVQITQNGIPGEKNVSTSRNE